MQSIVGDCVANQIASQLVSHLVMLIANRSGSHVSLEGKIILDFWLCT